MPSTNIERDKALLEVVRAGPVRRSEWVDAALQRQPFKGPSPRKNEFAAKKSVDRFAKYLSDLNLVQKKDDGRYFWFEDLLEFMTEKELKDAKEHAKSLIFDSFQSGDEEAKSLPSMFADRNPPFGFRSRLFFNLLNRRQGNMGLRVVYLTQHVKKGYPEFFQALQNYWNLGPVEDRAKETEWQKLEREKLKDALWNYYAGMCSLVDMGNPLKGSCDACPSRNYRVKKAP